MTRRRRVVAPPTRLGASEEGDLTALAGPPRRPTPPADDQRPDPAGAARAGTGPAADAPLPDRAQEDTDEAWGDAPDSDAHLQREKPPHWQ